MDPAFDFRKMPTVRELAGEAIEDLVTSAQDEVDNQKRKSERKAYDLLLHAP